MNYANELFGQDIDSIVQELHEPLSAEEMKISIKQQIDELAFLIKVVKKLKNYGRRKRRAGRRV